MPKLETNISIKFTPLFHICMFLVRLTKSEKLHGIFMKDIEANINRYARIKTEERR